MAIALRCIGEGHVSSIGFAEAVIDADDAWTFEERATPLSASTVWGGEWSRQHFGRALEHEGHLTDLASAVLSELPERFTVAELEYALLELPDQLSTRPDSRWPTQAMRDMAASAYRADFTPDTPLSARMLLPVAAEENHGMEDARFVRFTDADGVVGLSRDLHRVRRTRHRAAADHIARSREFAIHRLTGSGAHNKGMALFPRLVGGLHLALSRTDGENISLATIGRRRHLGRCRHRPSPDRAVGARAARQLRRARSRPRADGWSSRTAWGRCAPTRSARFCSTSTTRRASSGRLRRAAAAAGAAILRDGYVPRVVYSCGAIAHRGTLWIPVGVGDDRIRVFSIGIDEVITSLRP